MIILTLLVAYLIGSIPTGYWIGRYVYHKDIRKLGSGNLGATNVFRTLGKTPGIITLAVDVSKGVLATLLGMWLILDAHGAALACGLLSIAGHVTSPWVGFKGGKGVATACGVFLVLLPLPSLISIASFFIVFLPRRIVSLGALVSSVVLVLSAWLLNSPKPFVIAAGVVTAFVFWTHRANIGRLIRGEEHHFRRTTS